jgi:hypothetical protein
MTWIQQLNIWLNSLVTDPRLLQWAFVGGLALLFFLLSFLVGRAIQHRFDPVKGRIEAGCRGPGRSRCLPG